jgi:transposase
MAVDNPEEAAMEPLIARGAGLDVHNETGAVWVRVPGPTGARGQHVRTVGTMTAALLVWRDGRTAQGVRQVARERPGVYGQPIDSVRDEAFTCLWVNAAHRRNVPGRKTDVQACVWIAQWLEHGLLRGRVVPPGPIREWRDLTRYRKRLIPERVRETQRLQKVLEDAGGKRAAGAPDIRGAQVGRCWTRSCRGLPIPRGWPSGPGAGGGRSGQRGERPGPGAFGGHHGFLVSARLAQRDDLAEAIERVSQQIEEPRRPFAARVQPLAAIPGLNQRAIEGSVAEIGLDMSPFPSDRQLGSGAGIGPGHHERAGKRQSGTTRKGTRWLRTALIEAALGAMRVKDRRLAARDRRIMRHRGHQNAGVAVAHTSLGIIYHMLQHQVPDQEVGAASLDQRDREQATRRYVKQWERLGQRVILERAA